MRKISGPLAVFVAGVLLGLVVIVIAPKIGGGLFAQRYGVYVLRSGDIYVGEVQRFSKITLADPWYFQRVQTATSTNQFLVSWNRGTIWQPEATLTINPEEVAVWSYVMSDSPLVKTLSEAKAQGKGVIQIQ